METNTGGPSWLPLASLEEDIGSYVTGRMPSRYVGTPLGWPREGEVFLLAHSMTDRGQERISHTSWLMWGQNREQRNSW